MNEQIKDRPSARTALLAWDSYVREYRKGSVYQLMEYRQFLFYMVQAYGPRVGGYASPYCVGKGD